MPRTTSRITPNAAAPIRMNFFGKGFFGPAGAVGFASGVVLGAATGCGAGAGVGSGVAGAAPGVTGAGSGVGTGVAGTGLGLIFEFGSILNSVNVVFIIAKYNSLLLSLFAKCK